MQKIILEKPFLLPLIPDWILEWAVPEYQYNMDPEHLERKHLYDYRPKDLPEKGMEVFDHLKRRGIIRTCLSLQDGVSLISKGVLQTWFRERHLCLWRSTALGACGNLFVPWIQNISRQYPRIYWWWLEYNMYKNHNTIQSILFDQKLSSHLNDSPAA